VSDRTERTESEKKVRAPRVQPLLFLVVEAGRIDGGVRIALGDLDTIELRRGDARAYEQSGPKGRSLSIADKRMSSSHARLVLRDTSWFVEDLGSTNGTLVNGARATGEKLRDRDVVEVGQTLFVYREHVDDAPGRVKDLDAASLTNRLPGLATLDPGLARKLERLERVAPSLLSIILVGETGTGKEVLARAIHALSNRPGLFIAVNCGAIPPNLVESHLFGHVKGAFSGAVRDEPGHVRAAQHGTLLLDEIGDLPASSQAALLRVLQEGEVVPVGASHPAKVDVRILAATHKPLEALVEKGDFRRDLFARLSGYVFTLPPLRERLVDLGLVVASLVASGKLPAGTRLHHEAARAMLRYDWPMNVRELEQCLRASVLLADRSAISLDDLPPAVAAALDVDTGEEETAGEDDAELKRELLMRLADARGNLSEVARAMGKARQQVQRWVRRLGIDAEAFRK
jgi:transcriptional regulator with PAS, ATPase and Fis domain